MHRTQGTRRAARLLAGVASLVLLALVSFGAQPAAAATKSNPGWHEICANSVSFATDAGTNSTLTWGDFTYVDSYYDGFYFEHSAYVYAYRYVTGYGWMYLGSGFIPNGWFC